MPILMLALALMLATVESRAAEFRFEIRNCNPKDIDVWVYNGGDISRWAAASGWQGMKLGQTIGFVCDESGRGYCQVDIRILNPGPDEQASRPNPYRVDVRATTCFGRHYSSTNYIDGNCDLCPP
ncbi:MAG: hypothetical protein AB7O45_13315 [Alphaproteobacteria bacterium]